MKILEDNLEKVKFLKIAYRPNIIATGRRHLEAEFALALAHVWDVELMAAEQETEKI